MTENDIENIRSSVTMSQLASMYGYKVNIAGMMKCPFHQDSHPSLKVYDGNRGYYCFVCGEGGDIFDFTMRHDGLTFPEAAKQIASMAGIPISDGKSSLSESARNEIQKRKAEREAKEKAKEARNRRMVEISDKLRILETIKSKSEPLSHVWCGAEDNIVKLSIEWEQLFNGH